VGVVRIETLLDVLVDGEDCKIHVLNCRSGGLVYQGDLYICYIIITMSGLCILNIDKCTRDTPAPGVVELLHTYRLVCNNLLSILKSYLSTPVHTCMHTSKFLDLTSL
jgi:hypothetical protein